MAMRRLTQSGLVRLSNRRLLQLQGADASRYIQAILTNDMKSFEGEMSGDALYGAFLTTKGRVTGDCHVVRLSDDTFLLDYDEALEGELKKHWMRYKVRMKVKMEDQSDKYAAYAALPAAVTAIGNGYEVAQSTAQALETLQKRNEFAQTTDGVLYQDPRDEAFGVRAIIPSSEKLHAPEEYQEWDLAAYFDRLVFLGAAEGKTLSDGIPLESNLELLHGVSFQKGCYVGQELTARTQFKGSIRKRYVPMALISSDQHDLIKTLSQLPFERLDAPSHRFLREFLATNSTPKASGLVEGVKIVAPGSTKAVGTVVSVGQDVSAAVAMMRLERLMPTNDDAVPPSMEFTTQDGAFHAIPYVPMWWPKIDPRTGKMVV